MKFLMSLLGVFVMLGLSEAAEKMELFKCEKKEYLIDSDAVAEPLKAERVTLSVFHMGDRIKNFTFEKKELQDLYEKALAYDSSEDPFYGKGEYFILKNEKDSYVIFFEDDDRSEFTKGKRFSIGKLTELGKGSSVYVGAPYKGSSFDKKIIAELKAKE